MRQWSGIVDTTFPWVVYLARSEKVDQKVITERFVGVGHQQNCLANLERR